MRYIISLLRPQIRAVLEWTEFPKNLARLYAFLNDHRSTSYISDGTSVKSRFRIWIENLIWLVKYREVNEYYFLYQFHRQLHCNTSEYISYRKFRILRDRSNRNGHITGHDYRVILRDKFIFGKYMESLRVPVPRTIAYIDQGKIRWEGDSEYRDVSTLYDASRDDFSSYCKYVFGECGNDVFRLVKKEGTIFLDGCELTREKLLQRIKGTYLIQEEVIQHQELSKFYPLATNTLRLFTVMTRKGPELFYGIMRFGAKGNSVDNWAAGGIAVKVDLDTGQLYSEGYFKTEYGEKVTAHPYSGREFGGFSIPFFEDSVALVRKAHRYLRDIRYIGWDVAITHKGPILIEGNDNWGMVMQCFDHRGWKRWMIENSRPCRPEGA